VVERLAVLLLGIAGLQADAYAEKILFVGNSFTYGGGSRAVESYRSGTVTDLNREGMGGVPALFEAFTRAAGLDYEVFLETAGGMNLDYHFESKAPLIARRWDHVVLQGYSLLDENAPGDPAKLVEYSGRLAELFHAKNPQVQVRLVATWSRADQTYLPSGHWYGKPIASRNPYRGVAPRQVNLWADDGYHASAYGSYLAALVVFGSVTGRDPRSLGGGELAAAEIGISPAEAQALQRIAFETIEGDRKR
jgi:hypothetical protein